MNIGEIILEKIKHFFVFILTSVCEIISMAMLTIYSIIYKVFSIAIAVTNLGFVVGIILLVMNIIEVCKYDVVFTKTQFFNDMIFLFILHSAVYIIYKILSIKADLID